MNHNYYVGSQQTGTLAGFKTATEALDEAKRLSDSGVLDVVVFGVSTVGSPFWKYDAVQLINATIRNRCK